MRSRQFSIAAWVVIALAALTRFADLGSRFFHHDEAIHAWMSYQLAEGFGYRYDPTYHGPLLYHLEALVFHLAGDGNLQARIVPAAFGVALVALLIYYLRPHLGSVAALLAGTIAVVSPSLTYYSRFNIHDILIAVFAVVMLSAPFDYRRAGLVSFAGAAALAVVTKLNAYFILGTLALYFPARLVYGRYRGRPSTALEYCRRHSAYVLFAAGTAASILVLFSISTAAAYAGDVGGNVSHAIVETAQSMLFGGFRYWWSVHESGRLGGPFHFYLPIVLIYEPLLFVGMPLALIFYMRRRMQFAATLVATLGIEWLLLFHVASIRAFFTPGALIQGWHLLLGTAWLLAGLWAVVSLWDAERDVLACWVFAAVLQFLLYSYANEKVPWLVIHIVVPCIVVVAAFIADLWTSWRAPLARPVLVALVIVVEVFSARTTWIVNARHRSNVAEPLLQIDYDPAVADLVRHVTEESRRLNRPLLVTTDAAEQWPFAWYFRHLPVDYAPGSVVPDRSRDVFITQDEAPPGTPPSELIRSRLPFYHWTTWMQRVNAGDVRGLLRFMIHHDAWGRDEGTWFVVWTHKDLAVKPDVH